MPSEPAETRPRSNFPESRVAFPRISWAKHRRDNMNGWHRIFWRNRSSTTQSHTFAALVRLSTITHNLLTFNISEISTNISEKLSPLANKHLWTYTRLILVPGCRVARSAATTFALFSHQKKTKSCPGSKFTCNFALSSNTKPTIKRFKRGSK